MEEINKKNIWRGVIENYNPHEELPNCLGGIGSEDYRDFQNTTEYNQFFVDVLVKVYPKFKALAEKMYNDFKETVKRHEAFVKRKKDRGEKKDQINNDTKLEIMLPCTGLLISEFAVELVKLIKHKNTLFFRPASKDIVEVSLIKANDNDAECENDVYVGFSEVTPNRFVTLIEHYVVPGSFHAGHMGDLIFSKKSMSPQLSKTLLCCDVLHNSLPHINRIFTYPLPIVKNGDITFPSKGYDPMFRSWTTPDAPSISDPKMTLEKAKEIINNIFNEFCFKTDQDKSNAIAGLMTPFLRGLFPSFSTRAPVFFYLGNRERVGKDYLAGITGIIYEGTPLEEAPISTSESLQGTNSNELRKKIFSAMISGRKRMHFSNNKGFINNAVFESIVTAKKYSDRVLGRSEMLVFDNEIDFSLSGNSDIGYTPDFANRCRFIRLFLEIEDANARKFVNPDLHAWVLKNRNIIFSALYSLVRNWISDGKPPGSLPFASFPEWANICGGIMESAGYLNPCTPDENLFGVGGDSETQDMKDLFKLCHDTHNNNYITRKDILDILKNEDVDIFPDLDLNRKADQTKFGMFLSKFSGRILGDIRLNVEDINVRPARQKMNFSKEKNMNLSDFDDKKRPQDHKKKDIPKLGNLGNLGNLKPYPEKLQGNKINRVVNVAKGCQVTKNLDTKKTEFSLEFLQISETESEQNLKYFIEEKTEYFTEKSNELREHVEFELKDSALLKLPTPKDPETAPEYNPPTITMIPAKPTQQKTNLNYNDFISHMLPDTILTLQTADNTKEPPLIEDIIEALTTGGFYTRQQIEIWIEMSLKQGDTYEPHAGRLKVI